MDSRLPLQGAWVQSLIWKLRSHKPCSAAKKKKKKREKIKVKQIEHGTTILWNNAHIHGVAKSGTRLSDFTSLLLMVCLPHWNV